MDVFSVFLFEAHMVLNWCLFVPEIYKWMCFLFSYLRLIWYLTGVYLYRKI